MDNREIARALGRTDGATKVLIHRAIRQLEELVKKAEGQTEPTMTERPPTSRPSCASALAPVDPPAELEARLEPTLGTLIELAADELEGWELSRHARPAQLGPPAPPAAAAVIGAAAAVGLVLLLRTQRQRHRRRAAVAQPPLDSPSARCATSRARRGASFDDVR